MTFGKNAVLPRLCALFTALALATPLAASAAGPLPPPRAASPEQLQQNDALEKELAAGEAPYIALQQQFDRGELSAGQYRAAVAALDARPHEDAKTATALPDLLRPHISGCTSDGYTVNIPIDVTLFTGTLSRNFDPKQPNGAMMTQTLLRLDQALQSAFHAYSTRVIAPAGKNEVTSPDFKTALDAQLLKLATDTGTQMRLGLTLTAQPMQVGASPNCLMPSTTDTPAADTPAAPTATQDAPQP